MMIGQRDLTCAIKLVISMRNIIGSHSLLEEQSRACGKMSETVYCGCGQTREGARQYVQVLYRGEIVCMSVGGMEENIV
jgi:hypothetical protein